MRQTKAIFFDVDSTLYTHRIHDFPERTKEALCTLKQRGYKIGIATSRCQYELKHLPSFFHNFDFDAKIVDGGALVLEHDAVLYQRPVDPQQMQTLIAYCEEHQLVLRYATFDNDYFHQACSASYRDEFFKLYLNMPHVKPYEGEAVFNILVYVENEAQDRELSSILNKCSIITHSMKTREVTAIGIDKSVGVKKMAAHWNIAMEDIICFGDGANDVEMLKEAGLGIAMGNGNQKAKDAANMVCGHIDEDGLYAICKELQLLQ